MKRMLLIILICFMMGCAENREWLKDDTAFASGTHWYFSWCGYKNADMDDVRMTNLEGWWGDTVFVERSSGKGGGRE
jgi:hypothetical protein